MRLTRLLYSARRSDVVLGLVAVATASGARPLSVGARTALPAVDGIRAMQSLSASRAPASAVFEVKVTPNSGIGQGDTVYISGMAPVDAANRPVKLSLKQVKQYDAALHELLYTLHGFPNDRPQCTALLQMRPEGR